MRAALISGTGECGEAMKEVDMGAQLVVHNPSGFTVGLENLDLPVYVGSSRVQAGTGTLVPGYSNVIPAHSNGTVLANLNVPLGLTQTITLAKIAQELDGGQGDFAVAVDGLVTIDVLGQKLNVNLPRVEVMVSLKSKTEATATAGFGIASKLAGITDKIDDAKDTLDDLQARLNEKCKCLFGDCPNNVYQNRTLLEGMGVDTNVTRRAGGAGCWEPSQCVNGKCVDFKCAE